MSVVAQAVAGVVPDKRRGTGFDAGVSAYTLAKGDTMNIPSCPTCRQPRPTAMRDEVMTGVRPKADQRLADAIAAAPATKPTHRWYGDSTGIHVRVYPAGRYANTNGVEMEAMTTENGSHHIPITYLRAREILGSAWPASWPQTDPDAPALPKAADADGWDYYADRIGLLARFRHGVDAGEVVSKDGVWIVSRNPRDSFSGGVDNFGPATERACREWLGWPVTNPDDHDDGSQSRRTGAATAAKCPGLLSTDEPTASATPGTDARAGGVDVVREYARLSLVADAAELVKAELGYVSKPSHHASGDEWTEYAAWQREHATLEGKFTEAFGAKYEFMKANLAALKAALVVA